MPQNCFSKIDSDKEGHSGHRERVKAELLGEQNYYCYQVLGLRPSNA
jgi:hypothetical protein